MTCIMLVVQVIFYWYAMTVENIHRLLSPRLNKYIPHKPTAKQTAFLMLPHKQALFGGQAGGGKSDALLMAALQYVDIPGYAALLLRKSYQDLKLPDAILNRMVQWMGPYLKTKEVVYRPSDNHTFYFKTYDKQGNRLQDATVSFGYIGDQNAFVRYQGIEIQFFGIDEVGQHIESDYKYLFSRLRKCLCPIHMKNHQVDCELCTNSRLVPLRARSTANPGGIGHRWVMKQFAIQTEKPIEEYHKLKIKPKYIGKNPERPFIPSSRYDNPYLDVVTYEESMEEMTDEQKAQLMDGDWGFIASAKFKSSWIRYYSVQGRHISLGPNMNGRMIDMEHDVQVIFQTVDSASSAKQGPGDIEIMGLKKRSWTTISTWLFTNCGNLLWLDLLRFRKEIPEVVDELHKAYQRWNPAYAVVESNGIGRGVIQYAKSHGMRIEPTNREIDKVVNATTAVIQMEKGRVWLPQDSYPWKQDVIDEVFTWQGHPHESDDVVDNLADAANHVDWSAADDPESYMTHNQIATGMYVPKLIRIPGMYNLNQ